MGDENAATSGAESRPRRPSGDASLGAASPKQSGATAAASEWVFAAEGARATAPGQPPSPTNAAEVRRLLLAFGLTDAQIESAARADPLLWHYECAIAASSRRSFPHCHLWPSSVTSPVHAQPWAHQPPQAIPHSYFIPAVVSASAGWQRADRGWPPPLLPPASKGLRLGLLRRRRVPRRCALCRVHVLTQGAPSSRLTGLRLW